MAHMGNAEFWAGGVKDYYRQDFSIKKHFGQNALFWLFSNSHLNGNTKHGGNLYFRLDDAAKIAGWSILDKRFKNFPSKNNFHWSNWSEKFIISGRNNKSTREFCNDFINGLKAMDQDQNHE